MRPLLQKALADLLSTLLVFSSVLYIGSYAEEGTALLVYWIVPALPQWTIHTHRVSLSALPLGLLLGLALRLSLRSGRGAATDASDEAPQGDR